MERLNQDKFICCPKDLLDVVRETELKTDITQVRSMLRDSWGLHSDRNSDYTFYRIGIDGELIPMKRKGRYIIIEQGLIDKILL